MSPSDVTIHALYARVTLHIVPSRAFSYRTHIRDMAVGWHVDKVTHTTSANSIPRYSTIDANSNTSGDGRRGSKRRGVPRGNMSPAASPTISPGNVRRRSFSFFRRGKESKRTDSATVEVSAVNGCVLCMLARGFSRADLWISTHLISCSEYTEKIKNADNVKTALEMSSTTVYGESLFLRHT